VRVVRRLHSRQIIRPDHLTLVNAGNEEVVSQEEGERDGGAAGGEGGGCHELLRERSVVSLGLRSVDIPRISIGGRLPQQQGLSEARLGYRDGSPQLGAPGPGLVQAYRQCMQSPGKQREPNGAQQAKD